MFRRLTAPSISNPTFYYLSEMVLNQTYFAIILDWKVLPLKRERAAISDYFFVNLHWIKNFFITPSYVYIYFDYFLYSKVEDSYIISSLKIYFRHNSFTYRAMISESALSSIMKNLLDILLYWKCGVHTILTMDNLFV